MVSESRLSLTVFAAITESVISASCKTTQSTGGSVTLDSIRIFESVHTTVAGGAWISIVGVITSISGMEEKRVVSRSAAEAEEAMVHESRLGLTVFTATGSSVATSVSCKLGQTIGTLPLRGLNEEPLFLFDVLNAISDCSLQLKYKLVSGIPVVPNPRRDYRREYHNWYSTILITTPRQILQIYHVGLGFPCKLINIIISQYCRDNSSEGFSIVAILV
ncbi:hypothetical protein QTP88_017894 [Uroleucon formosanum]